MVILEFLKSMIDNFGAAIIVPIIIGIIALFFRVKPQKAFLSALYAGVSLEGISLMVGAFTPIITPLVKNIRCRLAGNQSGSVLDKCRYDLSGTRYRITDSAVSDQMDKVLSAL